MRTVASSGWLPASIVGVLAAVVLSANDTPVAQTAIFGAYITFGIALPGLLLVRLLRGRAAHVAEDLALGLTAGYAVEVATYIVARAIGAPLLVLAWPLGTLVAFALLPGLRRYWRGGGERAPAWWSWALATMLGYVLLSTAATFFAHHHLTGTDTPYVDMPYHLALVGELRNHLPPEIPWVAGLPLAYHWFYYADAAATSWVTGIEPVTLLYRLSGLPMFVAFVMLTASAARRLAPGWWTGPVAVAVSLFGTVAGLYAWSGAQTPVFDSQTVLQTSISPTNLFGLAMLGAIILMLLDLLPADVRTKKRDWLLMGLLVFGIAGAKATLLPLLIAGLVLVLVGVAIGTHRLHRPALLGLTLMVLALLLATVLLYRGATGSPILGIRALEAFPVALAVEAQRARGIAALAAPVAIIVVALALWSFLWAGAFGVLARWRTTLADPRVLLLIGMCAAGLGAATLLLYPGLSQLWYLRGAVGAFGLLTATGISFLVPDRSSRRPLIAAVSVVLLVGAGVATAIKALGPGASPSVASGLVAVASALLLPILGLAAVALATYLVARRAEAGQRLNVGSAPLLVVAVALGFSLPNMARVIAAPLDTSSPVNTDGGAAVGAIPRDGIDAARWLSDHSDPADLVATDLHCRSGQAADGTCDSRHFWVSGYAERRMLVEGWSYTNGTQGSGPGSGDGLGTLMSFWDPPLLAANDAAFVAPSATTIGLLRDRYGVRWLFADLTMADGDSLEQVATLRFRAGDYAVYEIH